MNSEQDYSEEQLKQLLAEMNDAERGVGFNPSRITATIHVDRWWLKMRGDPNPFDKMDVLDGQVVASLITRQLFAGNLHDFPVCSSLDGGATGRLAEEPKVNVGIADGQSCAACPWNQWRSTVSWFDRVVSAGGQFDSPPNEKGKACGERRALVMLLPNFQDPVIVRLSTMSCGAWDAYANMFRLKGGSYIEHMTRIAVSQEMKGQQTFGKAVFTDMGKLERQVVVAAIQQRHAQFVPLLTLQAQVDASSPLEQEAVPVGQYLDDNNPPDEDGVSNLPF